MINNFAFFVSFYEPKDNPRVYISISLQINLVIYIFSGETTVEFNIKTNYVLEKSVVGQK